MEIAEKAVKTVAEVSVGKLEELIAKDLRKKIKNGEAEKTELYALAEEAYHEIIEILKPDLMQELSNNLQDVELYIRNQIEHQLGLLKAKLNSGAAES